MRRLIAAYAALALAAGWIGGIWQPAGMRASAGSPDVLPIRAYQHWIGPLDGRSCPSYPVCSHYAAQAIARYGLVLGSWLALDRLIHEGGDLKQGPWLQIEGERRLYDPLERNAFWLGGKE